MVSPNLGVLILELGARGRRYGAVDPPVYILATLGYRSHYACLGLCVISGLGASAPRQDR
jgi:hypothetical protein